MGNPDVPAVPAAVSPFQAPAAWTRPPRRPAHLCRKCELPVTFQGDPDWGKAVHTGTGLETGEGGHLAAPLQAQLAAAFTIRKAGDRS
jgi:hypothetical protein